MKPILKIACCCGLFSSLLVSTVSIVRAQDFFNPGAAYVDLSSNLMMVNQFNNVLESVKRPTPSGNTNQPVRTSNSTRPQRRVSLAYSPTPALNQQTVQRYIDRLKSKNPAASQAIAENFGSGKYNYNQIYRGLVENTGLKENDAADAMSAYLILGYMIVNNVQNDNAITPTVTQGVRSQVISLLASNSQLKAPGVTAQLGEELKLQTVLAQAGWRGAIKENTLPSYQRGIADLFRNRYGMDLTQVVLTNNGFAKR